MAVAEQPVAAERAAVWEDFIDIFYAPSNVFARRERGNPVVPIIVVTLLIGGLFFLNSGALQPVFDAEFDRGMARVMQQNPNFKPEMADRFRTMGARIAQVGMFIFTPLGICMVGLVTWLAGKLVDAKQSLRAAFVVAAYAYVPKALEGALHGLQALFLDPASLDGRFRLSLGVGRFLDPDTTSPAVLALLGRVDVFTIWVTVLIAIGVSVTGRIPAGRAAIAAVLVWIGGAVPPLVGALRAG
jgi:hypothetical protein